MGTKVLSDKLKTELKQMISEIAEIEEEEITDKALFAEDLGIDSMMALEIVAKIEKTYKLTIPEEKIPTIRCLKDVYALFEE
jgi:acyl carrier protein